MKVSASYSLLLLREGCVSHIMIKVDKPLLYIMGGLFARSNNNKILHGIVYKKYIILAFYYTMKCYV